MRIRILGSAAGGGLPQWNCGCEVCVAVRSASRPVTSRRTSTIAVGDDEGEWFLGNAGPDLDAALRENPPLWPGPGDSTAPIHGIFLTDAELDHTLGLLSLRQAGELDVYGTEAVRILLTHCGVLPTLESYTVVRWHEVSPGHRFALRYRHGAASPLWCEPFDATGPRLPRYARGDVPRSGVVVGYRIGDERTDRAAVFLPSVATLDDGLLQQLHGAHLVLVDGTFWTDDELHQRQRGSASARSMGHQPVDGDGGSLRLLHRLIGTQVVYTHLNNTNPMLLEDAPERGHLADAGVTIAQDGAEYQL